MQNFQIQIDAAEQGNKDAAAFVAYAYEFGKNDVIKDYSLAEKFYKISVKNGSDEGKKHSIRFLYQNFMDTNILFEKFKEFELINDSDAIYWLYRSEIRSGIQQKNSKYLPISAKMGHLFAKRDLLDNDFNSNKINFIYYYINKIKLIIEIFSSNPKKS